MSDTPESVEDATANRDLPPKLVIPSELIEDIPEEKRDLLIQYVQRSLHIEHFSGPLPPPGLLAKYELDVQRVIVDEAVEHRVHRTVLESRGQMMYFAREILGLLFGFVLAFALIVGSVQGMLAGHSAEGLIQIGGTVVLVLGAFLYTDYVKRADRKVRQAQQGQSAELQIRDSTSNDPDQDRAKLEGIYE